jgi:hypothetical protein
MTREELNNNLIKCSEYNDIEGIKKYIKLGADINIIFTSYSFPKYTLLLNAVYKSDYKLIKYLLINGANPLLRSRFNRDFFFYVYQGGSSSGFKTAHITDWLKKYEIQKIIIDKYPKSYLRFKYYNQLNKKIEKEYYYLTSGYDMNLI